ncbi:MATE efflux family protein [Macrolepiota fuliginosa MF-IS2]|uniref:MATE efflux family protein n=1 Tax=Macrolepiota fuliginosa MF-IS2 TaxID=1400762 RepID=A0A9P5X1F3_9AGAR|nr:MATE efflux family protein [Macrolepiota fuliginosa MF-IS2]
MDSTSSQHHQGPASLPSDYALVSHYAQHNGHALPPDSHPVENSSEDSADSDPYSGRIGLPVGLAVHRRPSRTSTIPMNNGVDDTLSMKNALASETTPLLTPNPPLPRIEEPIDHDTRLDAESHLKMIQEELPILTRYALPVFGTHLLEYTLVVASVVSIGHLSTNALAAISLGSMTASVSGFSIIQGFTSALDTLLPSAWTSTNPHLVGLWSQRMCVVMTACLIPIYIIWFNAEAILLALKQDPEVARLASIYLRWVSLGLPAYTFNCISRRYFQSQNLFSIPTRIIMFIAPFNAFLNYLLVWGPEPIRLGFIGAPLATAISFNLVSLLSIIYGIFFVPKTAWHPISRRMFTGLGVLAQLGVSGVGQVASEWWAWELVALGASLLGPVALATQSVLLVSASTTFQAPYALSVATSVRIGNLLGENKAKRASIAAITAVLMALGVAAFTSAMFIIFRNSWAYIFNDDPEVVQMVAGILPLVALFQVFDGTSAVTGGILRAQGKQLTGAMLNLSAYYIIGIPFGMLLAFKLGLGLHGLWIGLTVSLVYCSVLGTWVALKADWQHEVEKVEKRLKAEREMESDLEREGERRKNRGVRAEGVVQGDMI